MFYKASSALKLRFLNSNYLRFPIVAGVEEKTGAKVEGCNAGAHVERCPYVVVANG